MHSLVLLALLVAGPMTLSQIETEALANNPDIQSAIQQTHIAQARLGSAAGLDDPQVSYRAWSNPILQPWNLNQTQHMFMYSQNVPAPGKRELRYLIASDDTEIRALAAEAKKREVISMVRQAFYRLLRSYDEIRIHHDQITLAEQTIDATRIQYTAGKVSQVDVLKAGTAYSRLAEHRIMFEREADSARAELNTLMGRAPDEPLEVEGEYSLLAQLPSTVELQKIAFDNRPELLVLLAMQKQGEHKVELARKSLSPDFTISAGYMLMPSGSMNRNGWIGEFSMSLPRLNRAKHDSEIQQASQELSAIQLEERKQRAVISRELREAVIHAEAAKKIVDLYRQTLAPDTQNVLRAATVAYQTDQGGLLGVLDSESMSIDIQYALFEALTEYEQSLAELERAVGAPLQGERLPL
jgi:cobalt-zinc-cadmium efflux system outer membrane protein